MAARGKGSQAEVRSRVDEVQVGLARAVSAEVAATASPSSMQLSLENKKVTETAEPNIRSLSKIIDGKPDAVGYAFAINGKVNSAEIYASHDLFQRMWPKLLKASAIEALAERNKVKAVPPVDVAAIRAVLSEAERGRESSKDIARRLQVITKESDKAMLFETRDREQKGAWIHRSYVTK